MGKIRKPSAVSFERDGKTWFWSGRHGLVSYYEVMQCAGYTPAAGVLLTEETLLELASFLRGIREMRLAADRSESKPVIADSGSSEGIREGLIDG